MRTIFLLTFFVLTNIVNGQVVIDLSQLAAKQIKSTTDLTVSDNTIDFKGIVRPVGYSVTFTGSYSRPIVVKNLIGNNPNSKADLIYSSVTIKTNTSTQTLKFVDCRNVELDGTKTTKILGSGNNSGQLIDFSGKWANVDLHGFYLDQGRNGLPGSTTGGAMIQFHGLTQVYDHGSNRVWDIEGYNANDEFVYCLLYYVNSTTSRARKFEIWNTSISGAGRDFWQLTGVDTVLIHNNKGTRGAAELEPNHISGITLNDGVKYAEIYDNYISVIPQWIYAGTTTGVLKVWGNTYSQGEHAIKANSAAYIKTLAYFSGDVIEAPKTLIAGITADRAQITYQNEKIIAPKLFRLINAPNPIEIPFIKSYESSVQVEETTLAGVTTIYLIYNGQRIQIK
jgi:hypothetical protein